MVLDSSALIAIVLGEPEAPAFSRALTEADDPMISTATLVEASIVLEARNGPGGVQDLDELLFATGVRYVAVDPTHAMAAREGFRKFGKGRSAAGLNLGDCFAYALAITTGRPLLFKGDDFAKTDVTPALAT